MTGSIRLQVYEADSVDMDKLSYPYTALMGHSKTIMCPSLDDFNKTNKLISWAKVREEKHQLSNGLVVVFFKRVEPP